ncbi:Homologous-pairing protein 2 [Babesia duncani]|uniref:Homologous-pairing protein 2 n=1 Tax=Babesia duncani TaxID=323732 RepID=A0AAD9PMM6_9APIC|nr:Homologous-pairing protein 2 [Babesia duncani]
MTPRAVHAGELQGAAVETATNLLIGRANAPGSSLPRGTDKSILERDIMEVRKILRHHMYTCKHPCTAANIFDHMQATIPKQLIIDGMNQLVAEGQLMAKTYYGIRIYMSRWVFEQETKQQIKAHAKDLEADIAGLELRLEELNDLVDQRKNYLILLQQAQYKLERMELLKREIDDVSGNTRSETSEASYSSVDIEQLHQDQTDYSNLLNRVRKVCIEGILKYSMLLGISPSEFADKLGIALDEAALVDLGQSDPSIQGLDSL